MTFDAWLTAKGYDAANLTDQMKEHLHMAYQAEQKKELDIDKERLEIRAEGERVGRIQKITTEAQRDDATRGGRKFQVFQDLCDKAIEEKWNVEQFQLSMLREERRTGPMVMAPQMKDTLGDDILEAAVAKTVGLQNLEKSYSADTLQQAHTRFRNGIGLKELLQIAAQRNNNYRGSTNDVVGLCRAAFGRPTVQYPEYAPRMDVGPSTIAVPGILSNVANKFLEMSFNFAEQSWREIARIRPLRDFKQASMYRLDGGGKFVKVPPGGTIQHGTLSELSYTLQADTYGILIGLDRRDIINDDLGAFAGVAEQIGRGAADSLNEVFWTVWLNDSTFFPTDKSKANYDDGATDSVLTLAGLENGYVIFRSQTKADGTPFGAEPRILLVPINLAITAQNLMAGQYTAAAQSTPTVTTANVFQGRFRVVVTNYLSNSAITGNSATAWYLLADPNDVAAIQVGFLNGVDRPTVQTAEFDFDRLGMAMRGYMDFGVNQMEYRAGTKLKGAA